jgi:hypothetical protein
MRLIFVTDSAVVTNEGRNALTAFLEAKGWSVWHWFQDLWLIDNVPEDTKLGSLRDEIKSVIPTLTRIMIMTTEGEKNHAGQVPTEGIKWINEHWMKR